MNFAAGSLNSKSPNYRAKYDDRKGLGYGLLEPVFDVPAIAAGTYPYSEPDNFEPNQEDQMSDEELDAFVVIDKVNTHQVGDGNTMVVVVYRVEFDEKMPSDGKSGEDSTGTEKSKLMNESG